MPRVSTNSSRLPLSLLALLVALAAALCLGAGPARAATVTVAPGDTLGAIAARSGLSVRALARANGIADPDHVVAGRRLVVPGASGASAAGSASGGVYRVRAGDSLGAIASRHGTSVAALVAANHIRDPNVIAVGRRLVLSGGGGGGPAGAASTSYRVRPGDSLGAIAARHGTNVSALAALNGIRNPSLIAVGRVLTVPGARPGAASATPTSSAQVVGLIDAHASRYGVDPALVRAIAWQESGWTQSARSSTGAIGVMQLMPDTARWLGADIVGRRLDPRRIEDNIEGGVAYLGWLRRHGGSTRAAVGGYYQGLASLRTRGPYDDTKSYVANVLSLVGRV
jgi:LysM repeat protein